MLSRLTFPVLFSTLLIPAVSSAQQKPRPPAQQPARSRSIDFSGYGMLGGFSFAAKESFNAILGTTSGPIFGAGARVSLPWRNLFVDVGAWRFSDGGERVFVSNGEVFPLNIPLEIAMTPLEISAGWKFQLRRMPTLRPYLGGGFTTMKYTETSDFADESENVDERFSGYHLFGGAEYRIARWVGVAGEAAWTTVPDAIGESGVSAVYNENDLGGATFRVKIIVGK